MVWQTSFKTFQHLLPKSWCVKKVETLTKFYFFSWCCYKAQYVRHWLGGQFMYFISSNCYISYNCCLKLWQQQYICKGSLLFTCPGRSWNEAILFSWNPNFNNLFICLREVTTPLPKHMAIYSITWALPSELELIFGYPLTDRISEKWRWLRSEFLKKKKKKRRRRRRRFTRLRRLSMYKYRADYLDKNVIVWTGYWIEYFL